MGINNTVLVVIDVQGKLASLMFEHEHLFANMERLIKGGQILEIPILWTEQAPHKIGGTIEPIKHLLFPLIKPIAKTDFSCYACPEFKQALNNTGCSKVLIIGIETHVCVYQTVRDLHCHGYEVQVAVDAVSSRTQANKDVALGRMRTDGITLTSAEMVLCEWLKGADHPKFREIMANIKR